MNNALTIDVEDWYHVCGQQAHAKSDVLAPRVRINLEKILVLLAEYDVKATFFMLGSVAEQDRSLVPLIVAAGHELASHGYSHRPVTQLSPEEFRDEIRRTGDILERQSGKRPIGYRAPQWSLRTENDWAFEILCRDGCRYDSSLNPLPFVGDVAGSTAPWLIRTVVGNLVEMPPMVTPFPLCNLPTGGGWGFRFFPLRLLAGTIRRYNTAGFPAVLYLHPREMDANGPRLALNPFREFAVYGTRTGAERPLRYLLERFSFGTLEQQVESWQSA